MWDAIGEYIPGTSAASEQWADLRTKAEVLSSSTPTGDEDILMRDLTAEELKRARFAHTWHVPAKFLSLGPRYGRGLSLYLKVLPANISHALESTLFSVFRVHVFKSRSALDTFFGALSDVAKKLGTQFHRYWRYFVNLNTLGGYRDVAPISSQLEDLRAWATGDKVHTLPDAQGNWTEAAFLQQFRSGIRAVLNDLPSLDLANATAPTVERFVNDPGLWGNTGATSHKKHIEIRVGRDLLRAGKDKMTTAMLLPSSQVRQYLLAPFVEQDNKPIMKREPAKVRAVVNSDDVLYLKMHFVSHWLERALHGNAHSTLFMSTRQRQQLWFSMAADSLTTKVKMPLDQSHFDWQQNRRMIAVAVDEIRAVIEHRCTAASRDDMLRVVDSIKFALTHGGVIRVKAAHEVIPITKGVMSGWRWTALLDTLMNIGELAAAEHLVARWGFPSPVRSYVAQGDDDQLTLSSPAAAVALAAAYKAMNFEVNPGKFWIDDGRDEFLRLVADHGEVMGYPSRAINNILWRPPVNADPPAGELAIRQQLQQWNLLVARGADSAACHHFMLMDMCGRSALPRDLIERFLTTPAPLGGCGLVSPHVDRGVFLAIRQKLPEKQFTVVSHLPGVEPARQYLRSHGLPERILTRAVKARIPRQGLRKAAERPTFEAVSVCPGAAVSPSVTAPDLPRIMPTVPELIRSELVADFVSERDFDGLRAYIDPPSLGVYDGWRRVLTKAAFGQLLTGKLPTQQPTVWGRGSEETSVCWTPLVNGLLATAARMSRVSRGWFVAKAVAAEAGLVRALSRLPKWSG